MNPAMKLVNGIMTYVQYVRQNPDSGLNDVTGFDEIYVETCGPVQWSKTITKEKIHMWVYPEGLQSQLVPMAIRFATRWNIINRPYCPTEYLGSTNRTYDVIC
jgi:hypothetical protein